MKVQSWVFLLGLMFQVHSARAAEFNPLIQATRAMAMGNAVTAVAEDDLALFYNPAGLAGVQKFSFRLLNVDAQLSNDAISNMSDMTRLFSGTPAASDINGLIGKNMYGRADVTSVFLFPGFGFAALVDQQVGLRLKNQALLGGTIGNQTTYGGQLGFGFRVIKLKRKKGELRVGAAAKYLVRSGGYVQPTFTQLMTLDYRSIVSGLYGTTGNGVGVDLGTQFIYNLSKKFTLWAGAAYTNMGQTAFSNGVTPQQGNLSVGVAGRFKAGDLVGTLSYDFAHLLDYADWKKKNHIGLELKFPILTLYAGLNQIFPTYGVGLDLWFVKVMYVGFAEEQGTLAGQDPEYRQMVHASVRVDF